MECVREMPENKNSLLDAGRSTLLTCSFLHFLQDGYVYSIFVLLPFVAREFDLSLAQAGVLKACISGVSSLFQLPVVSIAEKAGETALLFLGFGWLAAGYLLMAASTSFFFLISTTVLAGLGHSTQHPLGTSLVSKTCDAKKMGVSIGTLNLSGDIGKACIPFLTSLLIAVYSWRTSLAVLGISGIVVAVASWIFLRGRFGTIDPPDRGKGRSRHRETGGTWSGIGKGDFLVFCLIGAIDSSSRMTVFTFLPFLIIEKGVSAERVGFIVTLAFLGGIFGKFICGYLRDRIGNRKVITSTELISGITFILLPVSPLFWIIPLALFLGVTLNGTSSVFYSTVADFFPPEARSKGYGMFYTAYLGSGAVGPLIYGVLGDVWGLKTIFVVSCIATLLIVPLMLLMPRKTLA